tara:strand:- start:10813 stop:11016 length:204 start_codon:yes stop_codon:yes gene_type:complete
MNWIYWTVPKKYVRRYLVMLALVLVIIPQFIFGIMYTTLGFLVNLIWFDLIFYGWVRAREQLERMDE